MHVTLLVPDLFWPRDDGAAPYRDLKLPALELLLARSRRRRFSPAGFEAWLCRAFEVERQLDWPVAPITLALDGGEPGADYWLRADPVHLAAHRDRLTLIDAPALKPTPDEAAELVALLNRHFADDGLAFLAPHPARWYVRAPAPPRLVTRALSEAAGRDVAGTLPAGEDSTRWRRTLNEIQMLLHEHPVNQRRESRGLPPLNSVWLWGGGQQAAVPGQHFSHIAGDDALALALGTRIAAEPVAASDFAAGRLETHAAARLLVVADTAAARLGDEPAWQAALVNLERAWLAPLLDALRRRAVKELAIVALHPNACERFEVTGWDLLKFWRGAQSLAAYVPAGGR